MASKKKKKQRNRQRQTFAQSAGRETVATDGDPIASPQPAAAAPAAKAAPSYSSGITAPRRPATQVATGAIDIDARVPYFASDLRRVLVTAAVMIVIITAGSLLIH